MKHLLKVSLILLALMFMTTGTYANTGDGGHWFSNDSDGGLGGIPGDIYYSPEDGTNAWDWNIPLGLEDGEVDALSSGEHAYQNVITMMSYDRVSMNYSIDVASSIVEIKINNVISNSGMTVHDGSAALGGPGDLDALESSGHIPPYTHPFPSHGVNNAYFSVERSTALDDGDIYVQSNAGAWPGTLHGTPYTKYLDDALFPHIQGWETFDPDQEQLDALIVFDNSGDDAFATGDAIFFSLAAGTWDPIGDNIYYYTGGTSGGLYHDPGLSFNIDALDVHVVPEPISSTLFLVGSATLGFRRFRKMKKA